jgi:N12 class adenine-specific DNA methylase
MATLRNRNPIDTNFFDLLDELLDENGEVRPPEVVRATVSEDGSGYVVVSEGTAAAATTPAEAQQEAEAAQSEEVYYQGDPAPPEPETEEAKTGRREEILARIARLSNAMLSRFTVATQVEELEEAHARLSSWAAENWESYTNLESFLTSWREAERANLSAEQRNYSYELGQEIKPRGKVTRIEANLRAIRLSKELEAMGRLPSPEEKQVLAAYTGWGAYKEVFNEQMGAFRNLSYASSFPAYQSWEKEYGRHYDALKEVLTEEEWNAAAASTLNAHYTSPEVCHALWEIAERIGFQGGAILEPAMGIGDIVGAAPAHLLERSLVTGVELDQVSARIAKLLYPEAKVIHSAFQDAKQIRLGSQDLVITNVPFSDTPPPGQDGEPLNLHNFFINEGQKRLKPGGIQIVITSASTMENNPSQRRILSENAQLLGAIRLPNSAFADNANTEVVTDILVLRKPDLQSVPHESFRDNLPVDLDESRYFNRLTGDPIKVVSVNEYFQRHPEMVLGHHSLAGRMYGRSERGQYTVEPREGEDLLTALREAIGRLPANVPNSSMAAKPAALEEEAAQTEEIYAGLDAKEENFILAETEQGLQLLSVGPDRKLIPPPWKREVEAILRTKVKEQPILSPEQVKQLKKQVRSRLPVGQIAANLGVTEEDVMQAYRIVRGEVFTFTTSRGPMATLPRGFDMARADELAADFAALRDALKRQIAVDLNPITSDSESESCRVALNAEYDRFVAKWGDIGENPAHDRLLSFDPEYGAVLALANVREERTSDGKKINVYSKAAILRERTLFPYSPAQSADNVEDAIYLSLSEKGYVDPARVAQLMGTEDVAGVETLISRSGRAFLDPESGLYQVREKYLSGNVRSKLQAAKKAASANAINAEIYEPNIEALEAVQPEMVTISAIRAQLGASWLPVEAVDRFLSQRCGISNASAAYLDGANRWIVGGNAYATQSAAEFSTSRKSALDIVTAALNDEKIQIFDKGFEGETIRNEKESNLANDRVQSVRKAFEDFIKEDEVARNAVEQAFNDRINHSVIPNYQGDYLRIPGLSSHFKPRPVQKAAVARLLQEQAGIVAHDVGYGKTATLIISAFESKRTGLAKKPMIVCDNSNYAQFVRAVRELYPQANILCSNEDSMNERNRTAFLSRVATGNWDIVLMPQSHFDRIPNSPQSQIEYAQQHINELRATLRSLDLEGGERSGDGAIRRMVRQTQKAIEKETAKISNLIKALRDNQDNTMDFQSLGVDLLLLDEAHRYKRSPFVTSMRNIKGLDTSNSQKAVNALIKFRSIQSQRNGKGVIGATATPVTNTMAEAWNMLRMFYPKILEEYGVTHFDRFARMFCEKSTQLELNEASGKWKEVDRLRKFINGEMFIRLIRGGMDVRNDPVEAGLVLPELEGGKPEMRVVPLTDTVADMVDGCSEIYANFERMTGEAKKKFSWIPIMLMQVNMAAAIDPRLIDEEAEDSPDSLVNQLVRNVIQVGKENPGKAQVIFLDRYRTMDTSILEKIRTGGITSATIELEDAEENAKKNEAKDEEDEENEEEIDVEELRATRGNFNLYHDIRDKLIAQGWSPDKIIIPSEAKSKDEKLAMLDRANTEPDVVVIGSTTRIGTGCNFQENLICAHHADPPRSMTPADLTQRNGRIIRQGNKNEKIKVIYYGMKDTCMPGIFDRIARKEAFVNQAMAGRGVGVEFEDAGSIDLNQMKAALISDKRVLHRAELQLAIKEAKTEMEVVQGRRLNLERNIRLLERNRKEIEEILPARELYSLKLMEQVTPPHSCPENQLLSYRLPHNPNIRVPELDEKGRPTKNTVFEELPGADGKASLDELIRVLDERFEQWKRIVFTASDAVVKPLGYLEVGGMKVRVTREQKSIADGTKAILVGQCLGPDDQKLGNEFTFGTANGILKMIQSRYETVAREPEQLKNKLEQTIKDLAVAREQLENAPSSASLEARVNELQEQLDALETDMRVNPFKRKSARERREEAEMAENPSNKDASNIVETDFQQAPEPDIEEEPPRIAGVAN